MINKNPKYLTEQVVEPALSKVDLFIYKLIHKLKGTSNKKEDILRAIRAILKSVNVNESEALSYLESFLLNYRQDGRYDLITKDEFKDIKKLKPKKVTNVSSGQYVGGKLPFVGSNLSGKWEVDSAGDAQYVVLSYGYYPILIFKNGNWYINNDTYSMSTAKQTSQASRGSRNEILVSRDEMAQIRDAELSLENLPGKKLTKFIETEKPALQSRPTRFITWGWGDNSGKAKFVINDIVEEDGGATFKISIIDAGRRDGQKMVIDPENPYTDGNIPGVTKEDVEEAIKGHFLRAYRVYTGGQGMNKEILKFEFKHPNE